jgi:hypothetical protein
MKAPELEGGNMPDNQIPHVLKLEKSGLHLLNQDIAKTNKIFKVFFILSF